MLRAVLRLAPLGVLALALSCNSASTTTTTNGGENGSNGGSTTTAASNTSPSNPDEVVATAKGVTVTAAELESAVAGERFRLAQRLFQAQQQSAQQLLVEKLLEKEAGDMKLEEYLDKKASETPVTEAEVEQVYEQFRRQLGPVLTDPVKERIRGHVKQQRIATYVKELLDGADAEFLLEPPEPPLVQISADDDPYKGAKDAPVTIIEFSDFQCPACRQAAQLIPTILNEFEGKVKFVYRDFPLDIHPEAPAAAVAAECAADQGKFWEMHDILFENQQRLKPEHLKQYAQDIGLDQAKYDKCIADPANMKEIYADMDAGRKVGVSATPTFIVNGRMMSGLNADALRRQIKKELGIDDEKT